MTSLSPASLLAPECYCEPWCCCSYTATRSPSRVANHGAHQRGPAEVAAVTAMLLLVVQGISKNGSVGSLANLSAYLTLQRAEEVYGFEPAKYGLSEAEAADIAGVFSRFDTNEDGRLEQSELRQLW